jgi:hypothetical protein
MPDQKTSSKTDQAHGPFRVIPQRGRVAKQSEIAGPSYVVVARESPWGEGGIRLVVATGRDPEWQGGQLVQLEHANSSKPMGTYQVLPEYAAKAAMWVLE